jgi:acyl-CoA thioesterase
LAAWVWGGLDGISVGMQSFADVVAWTSDGDDAWVGEVPPEWMQGRASFGGIVAAVGLRALRASLGDDRAPRSIHTSFFGPLGPGPARVTAEIVRRGRFVTHGRAEIRQGEGLQAQVTATFADDRDSGVVVDAPARPARPGPEGLVDLPYIEGVVPAFTRAFALRWTDGAFPFSKAKVPGLGGWCRHRTDPGADPYVALLGLLDVWPSPVVSMFERPGPASSVTWSSMFYDVPAVVDAKQWWWYGSEAVAARHGYAGMRASLYGPSGRLAGTVEQLVAVFDRSP